MKRTAEGVTRTIDTDSGGRGVSQRSDDSNQFLYHSGSGDMYAGRDGKVYEKTADGWSQVSNSGTLTDSAPPRGATSEHPRGSQRQRTANTSLGNQAAWSSDLERDLQSRQRGYQRYRHSGQPGRRSRR